MFQQESSDFKPRQMSNGNGSGAAYRALALRLLHDLPAGAGRSVLFVGAKDSELASASSLAVSRTLATEFNTGVLAVDASRGPAETALAGCSQSPGLSEFLRSPESDWSRSVLATDSERVFLLPAGNADFSSQQFPEERVKGFLTEAESRYGFVVISGGPVLHDTVSIRLAPLVGCVLLFAREDVTSRKDMEAAQEAISMSKAARAGIVLATAPTAKRGWRLFS